MLICDDVLLCRGFQNICNVTANLLGLEAFNATDSIIELEQYESCTHQIREKEREREKDTKLICDISDCC